MLNTLLKKDSMPVMAIPDGAVFPLANVEDVIDMNEKLSDPEFMSAVVSFWGPDPIVFLCFLFLSSDKILPMHNESLNFAEFKSHARLLQNFENVITNQPCLLQLNIFHLHVVPIRKRLK